MLPCLQGFKVKKGRSFKITPKRPICFCAELPLLLKFGSLLSLLVISKVGQPVDKRGAQSWGVPLGWRGSAEVDLGPVGFWDLLHAAGFVPSVGMENHLCRPPSVPHCWRSPLPSLCPMGAFQGG